MEISTEFKAFLEIATVKQLLEKKQEYIEIAKIQLKNENFKFLQYTAYCLKLIDDVASLKPFVES